MKYATALVVPLFLLALAVPAVAEKEEAAKANEKCPISGKPVDPAASLNINGKPLYFCCENCPKAYKKKIALVEDKAKKCVLSGKAADETKTLIHKKVELVSFCCNNCKGKWADENKIAFKDGTGKCPISKKEADPATAIVVNGETVAFCCENCQAKYKKTELAGLKVVNEGKCPRSGKPGDPATAQVHVTYKEVSFCCGNCQAKYIKEHFAKKEQDKTEKAESAKTDKPVRTS